jgi:hypothetical protein
MDFKGYNLRHWQMSKYPEDKERDTPYVQVVVPLMVLRFARHSRLIVLENRCYIAS